MSKILLAWEFGENWGHLTRDLPVARRLRAAGHQVVCAAHDTRVAADVLEPASIPFVQAPTSRHIMRTTQPLVSHAEMLIASGYGERDTLRGLIGGWCGLFKLFDPNVVMIDYAPTALLAARILGVPTVLTGSGFELPPHASPLPSFRPWEVPTQERLQLAEELALLSINAVLAHYHTRPLAQFAELFQGEHTLLTTFPELDHYGARSGQTYTGPIYEMPRAHPAKWHEEGNKPRIFAYLRPWTPGVEDLLSALRESGANVICAFPGASPSLIQRFQTPFLNIFPAAVSIEPLLPAADLVIGYGSGIVAIALLAGIPLLVVPRSAEQFLTALRVEALGAGLALKGHPTQANYASALNTLLAEPRFRTAAKQFANKYAGFNPEQAVNRIVDAIEDLIPAG